ncbi:MAG TPA: glycosyl hydrolase, partial [Vicinamibacteria bacterium]|nr:glycosyl hydrolase [Vicinamibacteria bacterium]
YPLLPYLPFVLDAEEAKGDTPRASTVRRARYDFHRTVVELFHERFLRTYVSWAHDNGLLARMQAYGRETHPLEGSLLPDLPEGESWLWSGHDRIVVSPTVVNKYVSSAAHLSGRGPVSFEAMTNAVPVFREMPEDFKLGMDQSLLAGVQQPVMHGFNYSPPLAGFPGWVRFGSWLNEQNPWWPHFRLFADYAARLATLLSQSEYQASVALLGPRADEWAQEGLLYQPFPEVRRPWYHYHLWQALQQAGYGTDYVSEGVVQSARVEGARLRYGTRAYDTVLLLDLESIEPETAEALAGFAEQGGSVVLVGRAPEHAPGQHDAASADTRVLSAMDRLRSRSSTVTRRPAPEPGGPLGGDYTREPLPEHARRSLLHWVLLWMPHTAATPEVALAAPHPDLGVVHHREGAREIFFFANASRTDAVDTVARFPTGSRLPWRWDPETGERAEVPWRERRDELSLHLEPLESLLLVYEPADAQVAAGSPPARLRSGADPLPVVAPWEVAFRPAAGAPFERRVPQLFDLSLAAGDPSISGFGGVAGYRAEFEWADVSLSLLSLGTVNGISSVRLNGRPLGVRWYGRHLYDTGGALKKGRNVLEVEVTTTLGNLMRTRENDASTRRWAWWFPPIPAGLVGPVQLMKPPAR